MSPKTLRRLAALAAAPALLLAAAPPAPAATAYCSPTGDLCYDTLAGPPVLLRITTQAKYFARYRLCVTTPGGDRSCKRFRMRRTGSGLYASNVRWARHFPNRGRGRYKVRWFGLGNPLGPPVTFTR